VNERRAQGVCTPAAFFLWHYFCPLPFWLKLMPRLSNCLLGEIRFFACLLDGHVPWTFDSEVGIVLPKKPSTGAAVCTVLYVFIPPFCIDQQFDQSSFLF